MIFLRRPVAFCSAETAYASIKRRALAPGNDRALELSGLDLLVGMRAPCTAAGRLHQERGDVA
jgi:hypothetical protein